MKKSEKKAVKSNVQSELTVIQKKNGKVYVKYEYKCTKPIMMRFGVQVLDNTWDNE